MESRREQAPGMYMQFLDLMWGVKVQLFEVCGREENGELLGAGDKEDLSVKF